MSSMRRNAGTLLLLGAAHSLNHSLFLVLPPLLGEITRDLNVSFQTIGAVTTTSFLLYGFGSLVGGPLSDRLGEVKISSISVALAGASTLVFLLPKGFAVFGTGMLLMALCASFYHPVSNTLISRLFTENTAGAMGIHGAAASVGQMFTPTVAYLIGTHIDWRLSFVFFGVLSILAGLLMRRIPSSDESALAERVPLTRVLAIPNLWIIILFNVIIGLFYRGVELFFPTFLTAERGFSGGMAAVANSFVLLFGVVGQLAAGWAADRYGSVRIVILASAGMVVSMLSLLMLPVEGVGVVLFIVLFGLSYFGHQPAMTALLGSISPRSLMGTAYGLMFFFAFGLGSVSATIAGYIADNFSMGLAFWILTSFAAADLTIALVLPKTFHED